MLSLVLAMTLAQPDLAFLEKVAAGIEQLKSTHPQLAAFDSKKALDRSALTLTYDFHTHRPTHRGGWTSGVPNPDDDGVWFFIDVHDPNSMAQIHTQPIVAPLRLGDRSVMFLILEGKATTTLEAKLRTLLLDSGARAGSPVLPKPPEPIPTQAAPQKK